MSALWHRTQDSRAWSRLVDRRVPVTPYQFARRNFRTGCVCFFGFDHREMSYVLNEVEELGYVSRLDGRLRLTSDGHSLARFGTTTNLRGGKACRVRWLRSSIACSTRKAIPRCSWRSNFPNWAFSMPNLPAQLQTLFMPLSSAITRSCRSQGILCPRPPALSTPESYCSGWPAQKCSRDASKKAPDIGGLFACRGFFLGRGAWWWRVRDGRLDLCLA